MIRAGKLSCEVSVVAEKSFYRPDELARAADVSVDTVRRWLNRGLVARIHLLGIIRIPRAEFARVLRDGIGEKSSAKKR
jgi:hypothetical protein